jgi:2-keto-4-pentenoate hydratase/2-oxohepta-3-ene-1,7-dioic acid hydratase in catechol pathway
MKIFCIGRNYALHAKELGNAIPESPVVFMKPVTALLKNNMPFFYPEFSQSIEFEAELVLKIAKNGKHIQAKFARDYYDEITVGIDFTARDLQSKLKEKGLPWELAKAFDQSAVLGEFTSIKALDTQDAIAFSLKKNGSNVQEGNSKDVLFKFDELICFISQYFTLQTGDLIYTGTPEGVGKIAIGEKYEGFMEGKKVFECEIK